jgi:hypothetical protein
LTEAARGIASTGAGDVTDGAAGPSVALCACTAGDTSVRRVASRARASGNPAAAARDISAKARASSRTTPSPL